MILSLLAAHPVAALGILLAGILLIYWEANRPGMVVPGCLGLLSALIATAALTRTRPSLTDVASIAAGALLVLPDIWLARKGRFLGIGCCLASWGMARTLGPHGYWIALAMLLPFAALSVYLASNALKARRAKRHAIH